MMNKKLAGILCLLLIAGTVFGQAGKSTSQLKSKHPNILFAIADDQSYPYASAYGTTGIHTPAFDEVAKNGVLFTNAFVAAPQCSPSRAAILTGKNIWQLQEAGTHSSYFPKKLVVFTDLLEKSGYQIGFTGKPWSPGNWKDAGWTRNPVGPEYNTKLFKSVPTKGISKIDYFENFREFYSGKRKDTPFFFWYGGHEPHRDYEEGTGLKAGKTLSEAVVPSFLPDVDLIKSDVLDYFVEIEWFDTQLGKMINFLREKGELENTIIVVTADNGMPFPSAKANLQEYGTHVPLAICWPNRISGERVVNELVGLIDLAPTFLDISEVKGSPPMTGESLSNLLFIEKGQIVEAPRKYVLTGRERHTHARPDNLGYPARAIRTADFLFILNFKPDRWPAGDPAPESSKVEKSVNTEKSLWPGYHDIDNSPTKMMLIENRDKYAESFRLGYAKRPAEELFSIKDDPGCLRNLADDPKYKIIKDELKKTLENDLKDQGDPRMTGKGDIFDSYPRFGAMRDFPGFKEQGKYNPNYK
jgi:N-sulfoglucosamine sulfohydrolase